MNEIIYLMGIYLIGLIITMYVAHRYWIKQFPRDKYGIADIGWSLIVSLIWFITLPSFALRFVFKYLDDKLDN